MISDDVLSAYEQIIQKRFPNIIVFEDYRYPEYGPSICVVGIPEEREEEFASFIFGELTRAVEAGGIEEIAVMPYTFAEAEQLFSRFKPVATADA